jgi:glycosyltransferase involved in cell wall biosynthesis
VTTLASRSLADAAAPLPVSAPIRVLHFHSSVGLFGPERWTLLMLRYAEAAGIHSHVVTIGTKPGYNEFARFLTARGMPATHLPFDGRVSVAAMRALRALVARERIDVVHTHGFKTDVLGWLALRRTGVRLVTTTHGWCDHEGGMVRLYEIVARRFLRGFDRVLTFTGAQRTAVLELGIPHGRVRVVPNAVDVHAFAQTRAARAGRRAGSTFRIVFVGRVVREKGVHDLVKALALVGAGVRLVIVGDGEGRDEVALLASRLGVGDDVELVGVREDVRPFLETADVLALPSYSEGTPRVVMEAFAAGVPVVASDIPGVRVLVRDGETGFLVPPGRVDVLAQALTRIREVPALAALVAAQAHEHITREHSPERLIENLAREYRDVLSHPS